MVETWRKQPGGLTSAWWCTGLAGSKDLRFWQRGVPRQRKPDLTDGERRCDHPVATLRE